MPKERCHGTCWELAFTLLDKLELVAELHDLIAGN